MRRFGWVLGLAVMPAGAAGQEPKCTNMVYADSVTAIAAPGYRYLDHPALVAGFAKSFAFLESTPCDVLLTAHPDAGDLWERTANGTKELQAEPGGCRKLAADGRETLKERLAEEAR